MKITEHPNQLTVFNLQINNLQIFLEQGKKITISSPFLVESTAESGEEVRVRRDNTCNL